jgi:mannose-6-phosphate isomerase-like protein (cupin superfamily)
MIHVAGEGEAIVRGGGHAVSLLVAREQVTIVRARSAAGEQVAGPHVHDHQTDAFYVLEGALTFTVGSEGDTVTVSRGGLVTVPPGVAHSFRTSGDRPACWLTIHACDGGFARFMRGLRDGVEVSWDVSPVPGDGGLPATAVVVAPGRRSFGRAHGAVLADGTHICQSARRIEP